MDNLEPCELCGKSSKLVDAVIEGSMLSVCNNCAKFGDIVVIPKKQEITPPRKVRIEEFPEVISPEYPKKIKSAREKLDFTQKELALKVAEKESTIHQLESGKMKPTMTLAKKLENYLKIVLIEEYPSQEKSSLNFSDPKLTIGDVLNLKKK